MMYVRETTMIGLPYTWPAAKDTSLSSSTSLKTASFKTFKSKIGGRIRPLTMHKDTITSLLSNTLEKN